MRSILLGTVFAAFFMACAAETEMEVAGPPAVAGTGGGTGGKSDGGLKLDAGGSGGNADADACIADKLVPQVEKMPLDLVIYLDSSSSMDKYINGIKASFQASFETEMNKSGVDFIVISISASPAVVPTTNQTKYFHYPRPGTGSSEIPMGFLNTFDKPPAAGKPPLAGWSQWSRLHAFKSLFAITDSGSGPNKTPAQFETELYDVKKFPGFGTKSERNYRFHFMSGFIPKPNVGEKDFWLPTEPVVTQSKCSPVGKLGQDLAIHTGGLRFAMCDPNNYDIYFAELAKAEVAEIPIACEFPVPKTPNGGEINPNTIELEVTDSGTTSIIEQVHDETECAAGKFYIEAGNIVLCEESCKLVQGESDSLQVKYGCDTGYIPH